MQAEGSNSGATAAGELLAVIAEYRAATARLESVHRALVGGTAEAPGAYAWAPVRDPETGQRLFDWNAALGRMRFVTRWHGERREVVLPMPSMA